MLNRAYRVSVYTRLGVFVKDLDFETYEEAFAHAKSITRLSGYLTEIEPLD